MDTLTRIRAFIDVVEAEEAVEIGPEPGHEEHHFRGNEQHHAVAVVHLHDRGMVDAVIGFLHHIGPPGVEGVEHAGQADEEQPRCPVLHPGNGTDHHHEDRDRNYERPGAGFDHVVVMVLLNGSHGQLPSLSEA